MNPESLGPDFLKQKYDLHKTSEVESASRRTEIRTGEKVPQKPSDRIQNYLDRFNEILNRKDPEKRERGIEALKSILYSNFVIKPNEIPKSYFDTQKRIAREEGRGDIEITDDARNQHIEVIITDQKSSLDTWIDYLSSQDATYPDWLKYYTFRNILNVGEYDKEKKQFNKRTKGTVKPFPDLNCEALAYVLDIIEKKSKKEKINLESQNPEIKKQFEKLLQGENFVKFYAWAIEKATSTESEALANTIGKWVKYDKNSDHIPLFRSLQGHSTGWCTAGEATAKFQLSLGDFYVYYSNNDKGNPTIPRVAIRMNNNSIAEVRGIALDQNLDPYIMTKVDEKLAEFPDGEKYKKKSNNMKILTEIENKNKKNEQLSKREITFLYEIDSLIEGFGQHKDPRIDELKSKRNPEIDATIYFDCAPDQIAHNPKEIHHDTKAYFGKLVDEEGNPFKDFFERIPKNIEHVYTEFPKGKITFKNIVLGDGPKNAEEFKQAIKSKDYTMSIYAEDILQKINYEEIISKEKVELVFLRSRDMGCNEYADTLFRAKQLGLVEEPLVGAELMLHPEILDMMPKNILIGMQSRIDLTGKSTCILEVIQGVGVIYLQTRDTMKYTHWNSEDDWVFTRRNIES